MNFSYFFKNISFTSLLGLSLLATACNKEDEPIQTDDDDVKSSIRLISPATDTVFTFADDIDPHTPGIQVNIQVQVAGIASGQTVTLTHNSDPTRATLNSVIFNSIADFPAYTLVEGANKLNIRAGQGQKSAFLDFVLNTSHEGTFCRLSDPSPNAVLTNDADSDLPGFQSDLTFICQGDLSQISTLNLALNKKQAVSAALGADGTATFKNITLSEGLNILSYSATDLPPNLSADKCLQNKSQCSLIRVNTSACRLDVNLSETNTYLFIDDLNSDASDGLQLQVTVDSDCPENSAITLAVANSPEELDTPAARKYIATAKLNNKDNWRHIFDNVTLLAPADSDLTTVYVQASADDSENSHSYPLQITADGIPPRFINLLPADKSEVDDSFSDITALMDGIEAGNTVIYDIRDAATLRQQIINGQVTLNNEKRFHIIVDLEPGDYSLSLIARDSAGNGTQSLTTFSVATYSNNIFFETPDEYAKYNNQTDADSDLAGFQGDFTALAYGYAENSPVNFCSTMAAPGSAPCRDGGFVIATSSNRGGERRTEVTFDNITLLEGAQDIHLEITSTDGTMSASSPVRSIVVDTTGPVITLSSPGKNIINALDDETPNSFEDTAVTFKYEVSGIAEGITATLTFDPPCINCQVPLTAQGIRKNDIITYTFEKVALDLLAYTAIFTITDDNGNLSTDKFTFVVTDDSNAIELTSPLANASYSNQTDINKSLEGYQGDFMGTVYGHPAGSTINLCSSIAVSGTATCNDGGYIVATSTNSGMTRRSTVYLKGVSLAEGEQEIHLEVISNNGGKTASSDKRSITVDTIPPVIDSFTFTENNTANDKNGIIYFNSTMNEGTPSGNKYVVKSQLTVSGITSERPVTVYSDIPTPNTKVGTATTAKGTANVNLTLSQGLQHLSIVVTDENNNQNLQNDHSTFTIFVDSELPTITITAPVKNIYTSLDGTVDNNGTADVSDDTLTMPVQITVSDTANLEGSVVTLSRKSGNQDKWQSEKNVTASGKQAILSFDVPFIQGGHTPAANTLIATIRDNGGNLVTSKETTYQLDYIGAEVTLGLQQGGIKTPAQCATPNSCKVTTLTDNNDGRIAGYTYFKTTDNDLYVQAKGCPCSFSLVSALTGTNEEDTVFNGSFTSATDISNTYASLPTAIPGIGPGFLPGVERMVKVKATDSNGNVTYSNTVYLSLNNTASALITVERADPLNAAPLGITIDDNSYFGPADKVNAQDNILYTNLLVNLDDFKNSILTDALVSMEITSPEGTRKIENIAVDGNNRAQFNNTPLEVSTNLNDTRKNNLLITVTKDGREIGRRQISNIIADITAPTYKWLRNGDDRLGGLTQFNIPFNEQGISGETLWNSQLDKIRGDAQENNGFNTTSTALVVEISNIEERQLVVLNSDNNNYPLGGNTARTTNCDEDYNCQAIFTNLTVPNLPEGQKHTLRLTITDKAGNEASASTNEVIVATVDTVSPAPISAVACIGESTAPEQDEAAKYLEDDICSEFCTADKCARREGKATLVWNLDEADREEGAVSSYIIGYRALGQSPKGYLASCNELQGSLEDGDVILDNAASVAVSTDDNGLASYTLENLPLHNEYCFVVQAYDNHGNYSAIDTQNSQRVLPLRTWPEMSTFATGVTEGRDTNKPAYQSPESLNGNGFAFVSANIGDMDGDGRDDFAVTTPTYNTNKGRVDLFLSSRQNLLNGDELAPAYSFTITTTTNVMMGAMVSGGDLNGDGQAELVFNATGMTNYNGGAIVNGAVFIYDGNKLVNDLISSQHGNDKVPDLQPTTAIYLDTELRTALGVALAVGDVNGDKQNDLLISSNSGKAVFGFFGGTDFPTGDVVITMDGDTIENADFSFKHTNSYGLYLAVGDFNGDSHNDVAISTTEAEMVHIYNGPITAKNYSSSEASQKLSRPAGITSLVGIWSLPGKTGDHLLATLANGNNNQLALFSPQDNFLSAAPVATLANKDFAGNTIANFARKIAIMGDMDNDGQPEAALASPGSTSATIALAKITTGEKPSITMQSFIYGTPSTSKTLYAFGASLANIGTFIDNNMPNTLMVGSGTDGYGALYLYW